MLSQLMRAGCAMMALICGFTLPAFAARTPATDTSYEQDYSYAAHGALFLNTRTKSFSSKGLA